MNERLIKLIEEIFYRKLESKTGWGRNEIKAAYQESVSEAALKIIDETKGN